METHLMKIKHTNRFAIRPYGTKWIVADSKTKRILEFCDDRGLAVQLCATLNSQLHDSPGWRAIESDLNERA